MTEQKCGAKHKNAYEKANANFPEWLVGPVLYVIGWAGGVLCCMIWFGVGFFA